MGLHPKMMIRGPNMMALHASIDHIWPSLMAKRLSNLGGLFGLSQAATMSMAASRLAATAWLLLAAAGQLFGWR